VFGIITICIIFCCVWCCCLSPEAKARRGNSSSTHENDFGDEELDVHEEVYGGDHMEPGRQNNVQSNPGGMMVGQPQMMQQP
jgi:hypothetical protein